MSNGSDYGNTATPAENNYTTVTTVDADGNTITTVIDPALRFPNHPADSSVAPSTTAADPAVRPDESAHNNS